MLAHPVFPNILMHSDNELAELLGTGIAARKTIHEWPLSCVQQLLLDKGTKLIYKSQLPPTVESDFYERTSSRLLPSHWALGKLGNCDVMVIEWIDAPLLRDKACSAAELVAHGRQLIAQIGEIGGNLPVYLDIGSVEKWTTVVQVALERLRKLVLDGRFKLTDLGTIERIRTWAASAGVCDAVTRNPRVTHGDLKADQVFVTPGGYRVIDWQRPMVAPPETDLVSLLVGQWVDPRRFVNAPVVGIFWFLHLYWAVEAQFQILRDFQGPLFDQWASRAITHILA